MTKTKKTSLILPRGVRAPRKPRASAEAADIQDVDPSTLDTLDEKNLPLRPLWWQILVWPMDAKKVSEGGIDLSATEKIQEMLVQVGQLVSVGEGAFKGVTKAGISLGDNPPKVGDWVLWKKYVGLEVKLKSGHRFILMDDVDLSAVISRPMDLADYFGK